MAPKTHSKRNSEGNLQTPEIDPDTLTAGAATEASAPLPPQLDAAVVRFSLNLSIESASELREAARKKNITITDAVRRAIAIMSTMDRELEAGKTIESVDKNGVSTRFVFL
jgi:hypothetical protein